MENVISKMQYVRFKTIKSREDKMKNVIITVLTNLCVVFFFVSYVPAHCEIPCGIYDDEMRINMMLEHLSTIEKSMNQILEFEKEKHHNSNQLIRWVMNKENHANELQEIVTQYFMTQRIKQGAKDYEKKLTALHQILVYTMKCKQTTELDNVQKTRNLVAEFQKLYFTNK